MFPKIYKHLNSVPERPVISNCGTPTEKASEFLDFHMKKVMHNAAPYIKDSYDCRVKTNDVLLVTADVAGLYTSIPHKVGLKSLRNTLENRNYKEMPTENLIKIAEFKLKNHYFETNYYVTNKHYIIGTTFAPSYEYVFMDHYETKFLKTQILKPLVWFLYRVDICFI